MAVTHAPPSVGRLHDLAWLVHAEFQEMPGMRLTLAQARRLWNLSPEDCAAVFEHLLSSGMLAEDQQHRFCRRES
jgi:hypothetical protein